MELNRLEKYKKEYKDLAPKIDSLQKFLKSAAESKQGVSLVTPFQVSTQIGIDELAAFFILSLAEREHLVTKKYSVFSEDNTLIGEYKNKNSIPDSIINPETGSKVDRDKFYVEISFELGK